MDVLLIGGLPSSGSSLLMKLLSADNQLLCLPETGLFCHGHLLAEGTGDFEAANLRRQVPWVDTAIKVSAALGWKVAVKEENGILISPFEILRANLGKQVTRLVVEKCPENIFAFDAYLSADPKRKVVVTSRDLDSVCVSLTRRGFNMLEALLIFFAHSYETWRVLCAYPTQVFHCRFDDLISRPETIRSRILNFVKEDRWEFAAEDTGGIRDGEASLVAQVRGLLDMANWNLEDTAWTQGTSEEVKTPAPARLLGIQFDALTDTTVFATPEHGLLHPKVLDRALQEGGPTLAASTSAGTPLSGIYNSLFTRSLAKAYRPHAASCCIDP